MPKPLRLLPVVALLGACYTYTPIQPSAVTPGMEIRARLSSASAARVGPTIGVNDAREVTGVLVENQPSALVLEIPTAPAGTAAATNGLFQRITLAQSDVVDLEQRRVDKVRTGLIVGSAAAALVATAFATIHGNSGAATPTEPPSTFSIALWRVHF